MHLFDFIFPKRCVSCKKIGTYICFSCMSNARRVSAQASICPVCQRSAIDGATHLGCQTRYGLDGLLSLYRYEASIKHAIKAVKYRYVTDVMHTLVDVVPPQRMDILRGYNPTHVIPIPLHPKRRKFRGFNQAELWGAALARFFHVPLASDVLIRKHQSIPQVEVRDRVKRMRNVKGAFDTRDACTRMRVLLADDVYTTGATLQAAGGVLKRAGATWVWAVTIAR